MESQLIKVLNQVFELEKRIKNNPDRQRLERNINRINDSFMEMGYFYHNPLHEKYNETRLDCMADVTGVGDKDMIISDVIKPIVFRKEGENTHIIQKAVVIVSDK